MGGHSPFFSLNINSFAEPCDEEHLLEEFDAEEGKMFISCARSRLRIGTLIADPLSPSSKRCERKGLTLLLRFHEIDNTGFRITLHLHWFVILYTYFFGKSCAMLSVSNRFGVLRTTRHPVGFHL